MKTLTIEQFADDQEEILKRVEKGEKIAVTDGEVSAVLVPSDQYIYSTVSYTHLTLPTICSV